MTREAAAGAVRAALLELGVDSTGLNAAGFGGVRLGSSTLTFEHELAQQVLAVRAHLYRVRQLPSQKALAQLLAADAGLEGAQVAFVAAAGLLCLERRFSGPLRGDQLAAEVRALALAGLRFAQTHL